MDAKIGTPSNNTNTFEPSSDLIQEDDCNTLLLYLPGFTKEQLRVQLTRSRVLKISGIRPIGNNKWSSFQKDFPVSENCDTNKISAKFEDGILYLRQPKLIVPAEKDDTKIPPPQPQPPAEVPPAAQKTEQERKPTTEKTTPSDDDPVKQTELARDNLPKKLDEKKEEKATEEKEKISKLEGEKKEEKARKEKEKISEVGKKDERDYVAEKRGGVDEDKKVAAATRESEKREKFPGPKLDAIAKVLDEYEKVNAAARLKASRQKMMKVLALIIAFALGMYVSGLPWFSRKAEN